MALLPFQHELAAAAKLSFNLAREELKILVGAGRAPSFDRERFVLSHRAVGNDGYTAQRHTGLLDACRQNNLAPEHTLVLDVDRIAGWPVFMVMITKDRVFAANIKELPLARRAVEVRAHLVQKLGDSVSDWARAIALLDQSQHQALRRDLTMEIASYIAQLEGT